MAVRKSSKGKPRIRLEGYAAAERHPEVAVYALDAKRKPIKIIEPNNRGEFDLPETLLKKTALLAIGPREEDPQKLDRKSLSLYRPSQVRTILERGGRFEIPLRRWQPWLQVRRCVSGVVRHCHWHYFPIPPFPLPRPLEGALASTPVKSSAGKALAESLIAYPRPPRPPRWRHCRPVCEGLIEVYRRTCCCKPWVIYDPRLEDLLAELERLRNPLDGFPPEPWPPRPQPDPSPIALLPIAMQSEAPSTPVDPLRRDLLRLGTIDERRLNAGRDLQALRQLPAEEAPAYINARPYLACRCGRARRIARGFLQANGEFSICWREPLRLLRRGCHDEYSFVVKQVVDDQTITIYDGLGANRWHREREDIRIDSYHPDAVTCDNNEFPGDAEGAFVLLQDIGLAGSWRLKTPDAKSWNSVQAPSDYNDGLADPATSPADAVGRYLDRNWGGLLRLRFHFSDAMKALGARYYRVSVVASDANGDPTGPRRYLAAPQWRYYEVIGSNIYVRRQSLGPHAPGGETDLYEIPLRFDDVNKAWQAGQYHALLDTHEFANGRHLLTLEVFDASGTRLRPQVSDNPAGSSPADFTFRRWYQETGATAEVPFAALTHLFWWDNRRAEAEIVDLRVAGSPSTAECQFLTASGATGFSIGYRAYHPEPLFLLDHRLWTRRGLGGPVKFLTVLDPAPDANPNVSPRNVGVPPAGPQQGLERRFDDLLAGVPDGKCSFSANLHVNVKTFNGIGTLNGLDGWDQAAFALELDSGP